MARSGWFETVAEAQRRAKKRLPKSVYGALLAGVGAGDLARRQHRARSASSASPRTSPACPPTREHGDHA